MTADDTGEMPAYRETPAEGFFGYLEVWRDWTEYLRMQTDDPLEKARYDGKLHMLEIVRGMAEGYLR